MHMHVLVYREIPTRPQTETDNSQTQIFRRVSMFSISGVGMLRIHASVLTHICICLHEWSWYGLARHLRRVHGSKQSTVASWNRNVINCKAFGHRILDMYDSHNISWYDIYIYIYIHILLTFYMKNPHVFLAPSRFLVVLFVEVLGRSPR